MQKPTIFGANPRGDTVNPRRYFNVVTNVAPHTDTNLYKYMGAHNVKFEEWFESVQGKSGSIDMRSPVASADFYQIGSRFSDARQVPWEAEQRPHLGIDISSMGAKNSNASKVPILAAADGIIIGAGFSRGGTPESGGYGAWVCILHSVRLNGKRTRTFYAHLDSINGATGAMGVAGYGQNVVGRVVKSGDEIGKMGGTGFKRNNLVPTSWNGLHGNYDTHLHFEIILGGYETHIQNRTGGSIIMTEMETRRVIEAGERVTVRWSSQPSVIMPSIGQSGDNAFSTGLTRLRSRHDLAGRTDSAVADVPVNPVDFISFPLNRLPQDRAR